MAAADIRQVVLKGKKFERRRGGGDTHVVGRTVSVGRTTEGGIGRGEDRREVRREDRREERSEMRREHKTQREEERFDGGGYRSEKGGRNVRGDAPLRQNYNTYHGRHNGYRGDHDNIHGNHVSSTYTAQGPTRKYQTWHSKKSYGIQSFCS